MDDFSAWVEKNKAIWTRVYDEVITPGFEAEWKKRDEVHKNELKKRDENQRILFNHINEEVMKNARLVAEQEQLKKQVDQPLLHSVPDPQTGSTKPMDLSVSAEEYGHLTDKYTELSKKYQDLSQKIKYLERKNTAVMQKNRDMKDSVRAWQDYADRQAGRQKPKNELKVASGQPRLSVIPQNELARPNLPSSPVAAITTRTPQSHAEPEGSSPLPISLYANSGADHEENVRTPRIHEDGDECAMTSSKSATPKPSVPSHGNKQGVSCGAVDDGILRRMNPAQSTLKHVDAHLRPVNPCSSQTTEDESADQAARRPLLSTTIDNDDDDMPQFVSERSLKRKRGQPSRIKIYTDRSSDGTPVKPFHVKEEQLSSPPATHTLNRKDTIDLDDPTSFALQTPRHLKRKPSTLSTLSGTCRSNSAPPTQVPGDMSKRIGVETSTSKLLNDLNEASLDMRALSEPSEPAQTHGDVLMPIDPNVLPDVSDKQPNKRMKRYELRKHKAHEILGESGEELSPLRERALRLTPGSARAKLNRKLRASGDPQPSPTGSKTTATPTHPRIKLEPISATSSTPMGISHAPAAQHERQNATFKESTGSRSGSSFVDRPLWTMKPSETRSTSSKTPASPPKRQSRLRQKPVAELNIQDFRPNPAYNQGYSYAFSETVRKRGDRMCLPGCTNPQCCGSTFRVLAEAQAPLTSSQEEALLEDYLGEAYDNFNLTQMSSEERDELILQARTKKLAKETGKHRQAYDGRRTPPGFWRVDFPTTQEQHEDRERAKEQAKTLVQERWLEAHRKGGKWIFRDE